MERPLFYHHGKGRYTKPVFNVNKLRAFVSQIPNFGNDTGKEYGLALIILKMTFGHEWLLTHVLDEPRDGFLARALGNERGGNVVMHRITCLAELIVNLSIADGVESTLLMIANGRIEEAYAELQAGRLLAAHKVAFRFKNPTGVKGKDYDLDIVFPNGAIVCADTKCQLETGEFTPTTLKNRLDGARKQNLPKDQPGAIIVKIPQHWYSNSRVTAEIQAVCEAFLRNTERIVVIVIYSEIVEINGAIRTDHLAGLEIRNEKHRFGDGKGWKLLTHRELITNSPPGWVRLYDLTNAQQNDSI